MTSNPAWYALQALPYLMEYPYECAEQTFSRYYANALGSHVANANPKLKEVFDQWVSSKSLVSNLEKNSELKSILIQETPWLRDAQSETEQKKRIALLFDLNKMSDELAINLKKLKEMQFSSGGFPWFKGSDYPNRFITQHIASGFGHLLQLGVKNSEDDFIKMTGTMIGYLDNELIEDHDQLLKKATEIKEEAKTKKEGLNEEKEYLVVP